MIKINGNDYNLKYTIESWKKLKSEAAITPTNIQEKLNDDFADCVSTIIMAGLSPEDRDKTSTKEIDLSCGFEVIDIVLPAIMESMPQSVKDANAEGGGGKK